MKILAIDPGPTESAFVIWDGKTILEKGKIPSERILPLLGMHERDCIVVCEMIACYGMPVGAEVFETCVWIGRYLEKLHGQMVRMKRRECQMHLCNSARANDSNIRQALIDRLGHPGTKKAPGVTYGVVKDMWAALAVAVTAYDQINLETN